MNFAPGIGTVRISWVYVPCGKMTVTAQQMQKDSEYDDLVTFRKWNPNKIYTTIGSDNSNQA